MNTPVHITLALASLGKKERPENNKWVFAGALVPDIAMFFLFFYEVVIGTPQRVIWSEKYFSPLWQNTVDLFNSFPIFGALLAISIYKKWNAISVFSLAALLHLIFDFPLHNDDAHRHFYPFSEWRFESPISYWDPSHYGHIWSPLEFIILVITSYFAFKILHSKLSKIAIIGSLLFSAAAFVFFTFLL